MSAEQTPDIEALARLIFEHTDERCDDITCGDGFGYHDLDSRDDRRLGCEHLARVILDSPVLAAAVREALREAANDFGPNHGVARWLMDRASALDPAGFNEDDERCEHDTPAYATCEKCAALDPVPASEVRDGRADRVAEPQHEAATSGKESEEA